MNEVFPVVFGILVGLICSHLRYPRHRYISWIGLSVLFGGAATIVSGESQIGWEFLLIDIPLVAGSALAVTALRSRVRRPASTY